MTVLVTGYTDGSGSYRYNQRLSARRVWHVTAMLLRMGVPRNALVVSGRGENDNRLPTTNGVREPQNRVEIVEDFVMSAAFSPDGLRHTARVRDAATGREIAVPRGLGSRVQSAAFSPDRSRIVTTSWDNTARIWDVRFATMPTNDLVAEACTRRLRGLTKLTRDEMHLAGYLDSMPEIDVCAGVE